MTEFRKLSDEELSNVVGGVSWDCFGACLMQHGAGAVPALAELVAAIRAKDWAKVAKLAGHQSMSSLPLVANCLAAC